MKVRVCLTGFVILISGAVGASEKLSVRVSPAVAFAPANLNVRATIASDPDNRSIEIIAESTNFYRSSEIQLDGESAPRTTLLQLRSLPGGEYSVRAVLRGPGGHELASTQQKVNIVEGFPGAR
jgi:hypothetical protein